MPRSRKSRQQNGGLPAESGGNQPADLNGNRRYNTRAHASENNTEQQQPQTSDSDGETTEQQQNVNIQQTTPRNQNNATHSANTSPSVPQPAQMLSQLRNINITGWQPPEKFSFRPEEWPKWKKQFLRYMNVSGLCSEPVNKQIDALILGMGTKAEDILLQFNLSPAEENNFEAVLKKFEENFIAKRNVIYERCVFNRRVQDEDESASDFITDLHRLVEHCEYGPLQSEMLRDRILAGIRNRPLSEKLQLQDNLTLERATQMVRQAEQVKKQIPQLLGTTPQTPGTAPETAGNFVNRIGPNRRGRFP